MMGSRRFLARSVGLISRIPVLEKLSVLGKLPVLRKTGVLFRALQKTNESKAPRLGRSKLLELRSGRR